MSLSNLTKKILVAAVEVSWRLKHSRIGAIHLLFGVFDQTETAAYEVLATQGLGLERLREELVKRSEYSLGQEEAQ